MLYMNTLFPSERRDRDASAMFHSSVCNLFQRGTAVCRQEPPTRGGGGHTAAGLGVSEALSFESPATSWCGIASPERVFDLSEIR